MPCEGLEFVVLATDGLWDEVSDDEAVGCVRSLLLQGCTLEASLSQPPCDAAHHYPTRSNAAQLTAQLTTQLTAALVAGLRCSAR